MAYIVSNNWENKIDNKKYVSYLTIDNNYISMNQISKIEFIEEIIDKENEYMYVGTFRSNQMDITFKSLQNVQVASNLPVYCEIGLNTNYKSVNFTYTGIDDNGYKLFTINDSEDLQYFKEHYYVNVSINDVEYERIEILKINDLVFTLDLYQASDITTSDNIIIYPFEYVPKGHFLIDDPEENYYKTCKITCLDYGIKFKTPVDYRVAFNDGKITLKNLLIWLCNYYGVELGTYPNVNNDIEIGVHDNTLSGKTYISYIAEMFGGNVKIDRNGVLNIIPLKQTPTKTINALKTKSFDLSEKFKISKVLYQDAVRIFDPGDDTYNTLYIRPENMFVPDRQAIENIYNAVKDFEIYSLSNELRSDLSIDCWDVVNYQVGDNLYLTYYNNTTTYNMSLMSKVETKIPSKQQEQTTNVINANVDTRLQVVKTTIDLLNASIQLLSEKILEVSNTISDSGFIQLENAYEGSLHHLEITGDIQLIYPSEDLYPSDDLYPLDTYLLVDNNKYHLDINYLNYISQDVCDKYVYEDGKQWIERNVGENEDGTLYKLENPVIEYKEDLLIEVSSNSTIKLENFDNANYSCTYLLKNELTDNFATSIDTKAELNIKSNEILSTVSAEYETKNNAQKEYSSIDQLLQEVNIEVGKKVGDSEVIAKLNAAIKDGQGIIDIYGNQIKIESEHFLLDYQGNMTCNNANINGDLVTAKGVLTNLQFPCELWGWDFKNAYNYQGGGFVGFNYTENYNPSTNSTTYETIKSFLNFTVRIPEHFTIKSAKLYLRHSPMIWSNADGSSYQAGSCKNIRAYVVSNLGETGYGEYHSEMEIGGNNPTFTLIDQVKTHDFNNSSFETYSTDDFKDIFTSSGVYNISLMTTTSAPTINENNIQNVYTILGQHTGILNGTLEIIGYTSNV